MEDNGTDAMHNVNATGRQKQYSEETELQIPGFLVETRGIVSYTLKYMQMVVPLFLFLLQLLL